MNQETSERYGDILVVDDIQENLSLLVGILTRNGFKVRPADDGAFALNSAQISPPDLILLDINMPKLNGYMICESLKADPRTRHIPVIFISALDQTIVKVKAFQVGGVDYVSKPFQEEEVLARVKTHLSIRRLQNDLEIQNKKLAEEIQLREQVEHIMIHNLRNPLNAVRNYPLIIERQGPLNEKQKQSLDYIKTAGAYMTRLISGSLDLLKIERGEYQLSPQQVDIAVLFRSIINEMKPEIEQKELMVKVFINGSEMEASDQVVVMGEELLCLTVFSNLLQNAIEASSVGDLVSCHINDADPVSIAIHNQQLVPEKIKENFFEKYVTAEKRKGTGLGTYAAKQATEAMRGTITMESSEAEGTIITVELPADSELIDSAVELSLAQA